VMGGCDGRQKSREYFTDLAKELFGDTVIMTAGCTKYRYNKLKLKEVFELDDINDLPVDFAVAWYEQKAVCVLLALLALGFKGVRIGPTLPAFVSENVKTKIIDAFELKATTEVEADLAAMTG
jgi:hydroxylamine reductase